MKKVSVVIPAYNAARFVGGAIESVLGQTLQDFEVLVVDDGSNDDTSTAVSKHLHDPRIRYIFQENRGLPGTRNTGALNSSGEYLAFLDADDFLSPNALETMVRKFRETGSAWLNVGLLKIDGGQKVRRHPCLPDGDLLTAILEDDFITRSPFYPRHEFFAIGMYDEEIRVREDWDINIRMIAAGRPVAVVDEPLYLYTRTEGSITTGNRRKLYSFTEKLMRKHHKKLADAGNRRVAEIYAANMWDLARRYFFEINDRNEAARCAMESLHYDFSISRLLHPVVHRINLARNRCRPSTRESG